MSKQPIEDSWPSLRETWPPETAAMTVDEAASAADGIEGDFRPSAQAHPVTVQRSVPREQTLPPHEAVRSAEAALDVAWHELRLARDAFTSARENVAKRLADYNAAAPVMTPEQNVRGWIADNQAERARRAAENRLPYTPSVTQTAKAMGGGGYGNDIRTRRGGGAAYRRGPGGVQAFTKAQAMTVEAARIRAARAAEAGPLRPKLPSER